jgi:SAM-dependent methyltransferase
MQEPSMARVYDALLGGKDNYAVDRDVAERLVQAQPLVAAGVRANRAFVLRAVEYLAGTGIAQFLDLGCGIPTSPAVHEVAARATSQARTVYVDLDPVVLAHAQALPASRASTLAVEGDARDPEGVLSDVRIRRFLDFSRPMAVVMSALLHFVNEAEDPAGIVAAFRDALAPGSALVLTHAVRRSDGGLDAATGEATRIYAQTTAQPTLRTLAQVEALFDGFRMVPPGLVEADAWRPAEALAPLPSAPPPPAPSDGALLVAGVGVLGA